MHRAKRDMTAGSGAALVHRAVLSQHDMSAAHAIQIQGHVTRDLLSCREHPQQTMLLGDRLPASTPESHS